MGHRSPSVVAVAEGRNDITRLFGEVGIGFFAMKSASGRYGDDDLARVGQVRFHAFPPLTTLRHIALATQLKSRTRDSGRRLPSGIVRTNGVDLLGERFDDEQSLSVFDELAVIRADLHDAPILLGVDCGEQLHDFDQA